MGRYNITPLTGEIAARLVDLREGNGYSKSHVARFVGVSTASYHYWEEGKYNIPLYNLLSLAKLYRVPIAWLLGGDELVNFESKYPY